MYQSLALGALLLCVPGISVSAQAPAPAADIGNSAELRLRYAYFNPLAGEPAMPAALQSTGQERLWIVQFAGIPSPQGRAALAASVDIHGYLPDNAFLVRMSASSVDAVRALEQVRWVGRYHAAYRIDPALLPVLQTSDESVGRYNMVVVDKHNDKPALATKITALGGTVDDVHEGSLLFSATLTPTQLQQVAHLDEVLWIDAWSPEENDMNNARIQGGGNYVEAQAGYTGTGVNVHIYEGLQTSHPDFTGTPSNVRSNGAAQDHGHCTAGIVFGNGSSNSAVRGMAPDCTKFYTTYGSSVVGSRWQVIQDLVNNYNVSHTTASWGSNQTTAYTSISADADDIIFDHDIAWTQSQSNLGNQYSRPQAWAKNIFSIGGVVHYNNSNPLDDSWAAGGGSTGPAADGRIKPTLSAYYDAIGTSDLTGGAGYSPNNWFSGFGGTSGATPIVAGHNVLAIQMFTDETGHPGFGPFNNALRVPSGTVHQNRPHFPTLKALQVASAAKWDLSTGGNTRTHVGWGFPDLQAMWDDRNKTIIVDETDILTQGNQKRWDSVVAPGEAAFKAVLNYAEPAANPSANPTLINDLSLRVTAPDNTIYWGNFGLTASNWSAPGGSADSINPLECVFVQNPMPGVWHVDVIATSVVMDNHVETPALDADYGLVITGGPLLPPTAALFTKYGQGCAGSTNTVTPCAERNPAGGTLTGATNPLEYGIFVSAGVPIQVETFDIWTRSTGGTQVIPVHLYATINSATPLASTTLSVGPTAGFYRATFPVPVAVSSSFSIGIDVSAQTVQVPNLTTGGTNIVFSRIPNGAWTYDPTVSRPAYSVACVSGTVYSVPTLGNVGAPVLGTNYDVTLSDALASAASFILTGFSNTTYNNTPLPYALPNAPGCDLLAAPLATRLIFTTGTGTASETIPVPMGPLFIGLNLYHQWAVLDAANPLGIVVSDAGKAKVGT